MKIQHLMYKLFCKIINKHIYSFIDSKNDKEYIVQKPVFDYINEKHTELKKFAEENAKLSQTIKAFVIMGSE